MSVNGRYGFIGLGQMGGNVVKSIHAKGYSVMAANTAQSDLDGLDIPEDCKYISSINTHCHFHSFLPPYRHIFLVVPNLTH